MYWSCSLIIAHVASFISVYLYTALSTSASHINSFFLWTLMAIL